MTPLDPGCPVPIIGPSPLFWKVLRTWKWHSPVFADAESRRAVAVHAAALARETAQ